jgi:hypothetical protein
LLSGLGAAQKYISAVLNGQKFSWSGLGSAVLGQAVTGGISQAVTGVDADPATDDDDLSNVGQSLGDALGGDSDLPSDDAMGDVGTSVGQALGDDVPLPTAEEIEEYLNTPAPDDVPVTEPDPNGWR